MIIIHVELRLKSQSFFKGSEFSRHPFWLVSFGFANYSNPGAAFVSFRFANYSSPGAGFVSFCFANSSKPCCRC